MIKNVNTTIFSSHYNNKASTKLPVIKIKLLSCIAYNRHLQPQDNKDFYKRGTL